MALGASRNRAITEVVIDSSKAEQGGAKFISTLQKMDTATTTSTRSEEAFNQQSVKLSQNLQKMDTAVASSTRSQLGFNQQALKVNQSLTQTQQTVGKTSSSMGIINRDFATLNQNSKAAVGGLTNQNTVLGKLGGTTATTGEKFSKMGGFMKNNLTNVSLLAGGLAGLDDQFLSLHKAQVANERASLMVDKVHNRLADTDRKLAKMVQEGKKGTVEYNALMEDRKLIAEQVDVTEQRLTITQEQLGERTEDFAVSILPNLIFVGGSAVSMITSLGIKGETLKKIIPGLKSGLIGLAGGLGGIATQGGKINFARLLLGFAGIAAPVLAGIAAIWLMVGAFQGLRNVSTSIIETLNLQVEALSPLQLAYLKLQDTFSKMGLAKALTEKEKKDLAFYDSMTGDKLDAMIKKAKEKGLNLNAEFIKGFTTLPPEVKAIMKQIQESLTGAVPSVEAVTDATDEATTSTAKLGKTVDEQLTPWKELGQEQLNIKSKMAGTTQAILDVDRAAVKTGKDIETKYSPEVVAVTAAWKEFNEVLSVTASAAVSATINKEVASVLKLAPAVSGSTIEIQRLNNEMFTMATERAPEWRAAQIEAANEAKAAWQDFATEFNKASDLTKIFKFDTKFDSDKIAKDLVKGLPSKLEKRMKLDLKFEEKSRQTEEGIQKFLQGILLAADQGFIWDPDLKINDKSATQIAKDLIKKIDKKTDNADLATFRKTLKDAVDRGASESEIEQILADHVKDAPPIPVYIVPAPTSNADIVSGIGDVNLTGNITKVTSPWGEPSVKGGRSDAMEGFRGGTGGGATGGGGKVAAKVPVEGVITYVSGGSDIFFSTPEQIQALKNKNKTIGVDPNLGKGDKTTPPTTTNTFDKPAVALLDISKATANITRLIGNYNGYLAVVNTNEPMARLNITGSTKAITRLIGNFEGYLVDVSTNEPMARINITGATKAVSRLIGNFDGYLKEVSTNEPMARINITGATKLITRLIGNFNGYVSRVEKADPKVKIDITGAVKSITRLIGDLNGIPNITRTVTIKEHKVPAQHGYHASRLAEDTMFMAHKGEEVHIGRSNTPRGGGPQVGSNTNTTAYTPSGQPMIVEIHDHHDDREEIRRLKVAMGAGRTKFGF